MSEQRRNTNQTSVKLLGKFAVIAVMCVGLRAFADPAPATPAATATTPPAAGSTVVLQSATTPLTYPQSQCMDMRGRASTALTDIGTACKDGGMGDNCTAKVEACHQASQADTYSTEDAMNSVVNQILISKGLSSAATLGKKDASGTKTGCQQYSTRSSYDEAKKDLEQKIQDKQKELNDSQKDLVQDKKDMDSGLQDVQKDMTQDQKDSQDAKSKLADSQRQQISDFNKTQNEEKQQMRQNTMTMLQLKGKLVESQRNESMDLLKLNDSATKVACVKAAQDSYKSFQQVAATMSLSLQTRTDNRNAILSQYQDCLKTFAQQRQKTIETYRNEQETIKTSLGQAQSDQDDQQGTMNLANTQLADIQNQNTTQGTQIDQNLQQNLAASQAKMTSLNQNFQQGQQVSNSRQTQVQADLNDYQNQLNNLGPIPDDGQTTSKAGAATQIKANLSVIDNYTKACCKGSSDDDIGCPGFAGIHDQYNSDSSGSTEKTGQ